MSQTDKNKQSSFQNGSKSYIKNICNKKSSAVRSETPTIGIHKNKRKPSKDRKDSIKIRHNNRN